MSESKTPGERHQCPCCRYPTLSERAAYEICVLCNWEDDGQDDASADEVWGGPNSDYSLTAARENFQKYRVMYSPGRDQRLTGGDSPAEFETKGKLMSAFVSLRTGTTDEEAAALNATIAQLEADLHAENARLIRAYEGEQGSDA